MKRYLVIKPDNTAEYKEMPTSEAQLKTFQADVGGMVERVVLRDKGNHFLLVNEEGLITTPPAVPNPIASWLALSFGYSGILNGPAVLLKQDGEDWVNPSPHLCQMIIELWRLKVD